MKANAFAGLGDMLAGGFDNSLTQEGATRQMFNLDDIEVDAQVREEFEDDENSLEELGDSLVAGQIQPILLRKGTAKPYKLVAGERRYRAARLKGLRELWGDYRADMNDDEADRIQFAENVQRKNLTQLEEAKRVQRDLDTLGSVDAVLDKHKKSRAWLSKIMALLTLPEQAKRLVSENISADLEVINTVKTIEKADPAKALTLVNDLKEGRGKVNARDLVAAVKDVVKPSKKAQEKAKEGAAAGSIATPRDRSQEVLSDPVFADAKKTAPSRPAHEAVLATAYIAIFENGKQPKAVLDALNAEDKEAVDSFLRTFYDAGKQATNAPRTVIEGFRNGGFAADGMGAFALAAFLQGVNADASFSMLNIFGYMKP